MIERIAFSCITGLLLIAGSPAQAQWTAKVAAGLVAARGNADSDTANAKVEVARQIGRWKHAVELSGVYASDTTGTTAQRWDVREQSDFQFHVKGFWFESVRYEEDRFSGFEDQATAGMGFGWRFFDDPITRLSAQVGAGYKTFRTREGVAEDGVTLTPSVREEELIGQATVDFEHQVSATTKLTADLLVEAGADNTFVQNDWALQVTIFESLALALGYAVRYNSNPPEGFYSTDTLTTLNLVYEIQ